MSPCRSPRCCPVARTRLRRSRCAPFARSKSATTRRRKPIVTSAPCSRATRSTRLSASAAKWRSARSTSDRRCAQGDVIAVLDDSDYKLAVEAAQQQVAAADAQARQAESDRKRLEALKARRFGQPSDDENAQSGAQTTRAAAEARSAQARARAQSSRVHGAARLAGRRRHRREVRGRARSSPKASRSSRSRRKASRRSWSTCRKTSCRVVQGGALQGLARERARPAVRGRAARAVAAGGGADAHVSAPAEAARRHARCRSARPPRSSSTARSRTARRPRSRPLRSPRTRASRRCGSSVAPAQTRWEPSTYSPLSVHGYRNDDVLVSGPSGRRAGRHRGRAEDGAGTESRVCPCAAREPTHRLEAGRTMKSFNLTEWALNHRAIVLFLILAIVLGGVLQLHASSASSRTRSSPCRR